MAPPLGVHDLWVQFTRLGASQGTPGRAYLGGRTDGRTEACSGIPGDAAVHLCETTRHERWGSRGPLTQPGLFWGTN